VKIGSNLNVSVRSQRGGTASRDLGVARQCSNVFGASLVSVEEVD
jgi:hypothetical protein